MRGLLWYAMGFLMGNPRNYRALRVLNQGLLNTCTQDSVDTVEELLRLQEDFEKVLAAQEEKFSLLGRETKVEEMQRKRKEEEERQRREEDQRRREEERKRKEEQKRKEEERKREIEKQRLREEVSIHIWTWNCGRVLLSKLLMDSL